MIAKFKGSQDVESFLAEEREAEERDRETVRRVMERERPGWFPSWRVFVVAAILGLLAVGLGRWMGIL